MMKKMFSQMTQLLESEIHFNIRGYDIILANHSSSRAHGGKAMIISSGIQYTELPAIQEEWAQCTVTRITSPQGDITIGAASSPDTR